MAMVYLKKLIPVIFKKDSRSTSYFLDLGDDGCWLVKNKAGYKKRIGIGEVGKRKAIKKIEELNKDSIE